MEKLQPPSTSFDPLIWLADVMSVLPYGDTLYTILMFILVLGVLVFVHEWGHFKAAKSVGIWVEEFAVGFGPALFRWQDKVGTKWKIGAIPLGGYVHMKGQEDGQAIEVSTDADSFASKTILQRAWVVFAGPLANFVLALVVFIGAMWLGETKMAPVIGGVTAETPAALAGFMEGDRVTAVNGQPIPTWEVLQNTVQSYPDETITVTVEREGSEATLQLTPAQVEYKDLLGNVTKVGQMGVFSAGEMMTIHHGFVGGLLRGFEKTWEVTSLTLQSLHSLLVGKVSAEHIAGPLGIADLAGQSASVGVVALLLFMGVISVNLGIINLLPIPVLDGGHLLFLLAEAIKGSPVSVRVQEWSLRIGLGLILLLVLFATNNDIRRLLEKWRGDETTVAVEVAEPVTAPVAAE